MLQAMITGSAHAGWLHSTAEHETKAAELALHALSVAWHDCDAHETHAGGNGLEAHLDAHESCTHCATLARHAAHVSSTMGRLVARQLLVSEALDAE